MTQAPENQDPHAQAPHTSVLLDEVIEAVAPAEGRVVVDATFGAGGYSRAFLDRGATVIAFDRDPSARRFADALAAAAPGRFRLIQQRFSELEDGLKADGRTRCDAVAFDLGVSSMQLDEAERGFSFMRDGPLDMRMGGEGPTAADLVNGSETNDLSRVFWLYGEERQSRRIAAALVRRRAERPFSRTLDLAEVVERAVGGRRGAPTHPATRVFQALRIAVNEELAELEAGLEAAERALSPGGRLAVVTFHSLEDRIVKSFFTERAGRTPSGSRHLPPVETGKAPTFELLFKNARAPSVAETRANPRARSAKLRAGVRTVADAWRRAA
jgi:16S rRNA (cytosine1402-N4)-methyltransferase